MTVAAALGGRVAKVEEALLGPDFVCVVQDAGVRVLDAWVPDCGLPDDRRYWGCDEP